jgi:sulfate transport system substrate-binding protein
VLVAWENEALLTLHGSEQRDYEMVAPSLSILAEPPVAWIDRTVNRNGTRELAEAYLRYLYTPEGQTIAATHFYRPRLREVAEKFAATFPKLTLFTIDDVFGGWAAAQKTHFDEGGVFDQLQRANR